MRQALATGIVLALLCGGAAAQQVAKPDVGPAAPAPGVFSLKKSGAALHLAVSGHGFTSKAALENYLAFRAAEATLDSKRQWFSLVEHRAKGDAVPVPKGDPLGPRFSFRMEYFRPQWRWRAAGAKAWQNWSPFAGQAFPDLKGADYQLSADIMMHKGMVDDVNPLAFDAGATSDYLINQVEAPK
jgi:hypothetical protein